MNAQIQKEKGFTIIEVVLVLAIAALIFLMVFIALPALQRSQRDGQRRNDVSKVASQLTSYATNNRGKLPTLAQFRATGFQNGYLKASTGEFNDPKTGSAYVIVNDGSNGARSLSDGQMQYLPGFTCSGETATSGGGARQAAIRVKLEGSGTFCQNAQ